MSDGAAGPAGTYPSTISVSNAAASITDLSISTNGLTHAFPDDVDLLLVGPGGQKMIIQSDAGGSTVALGMSYVLSDAGAGGLPDSAEIVAGTYRPTSHGGAVDTFAAPAPAGPYSEPAPIGSATFASVFNGTNPNGTWSLYVMDDANVDGGQVRNWCVRLGAPLKISEFRVRGPNGANDEYIEIHNDSPTPTLVSSPTSAGFAIAASNGVARCVITNGTLIPANGHFLCVNSAGYSLGSYPAGAGTIASGNATYTADIPDNAGIAIFNTSLPASFSLTTRIDAVGSTSEANTLYKEGTGCPALTPFSIDYAFHRDQCGKNGSITHFAACPDQGFARDRNNNALDFVFVDTNGTSAGAGQRLGAPGPQNLSASVSGTAKIVNATLDSCVQARALPNLFRDSTSTPALNSTFGQLNIRRTITNNTTVPLTRLRYRVDDISTFPAPTGVADLRPITSPNLSVTVDRPPGGSGTSSTTVFGATLEQPPSQPNGGGFNSSFNIPLAADLAPGASIDVNFRFGLQQTGEYKVDLVPEGLPVGGGYMNTLHLSGCTDATCTELIFRADTEL
ncbi:hypothetical protein [Tahibacter sp.]|uniref:hypothetical protein n=1 Tax=Tahibacter sp. TaxID=2056211 RepID=UPI0028C404B5|nr:hypothetical protein [Tahibacter sp.]